MAKDEKRKRTYKPPKQTVELTERLLPELKDLEVGEETTITLKVRMTSKSEGDRYGMFDEDDGDYYGREYGKEYAEAKRKERSQIRGSFEVLEADEGEDESPEQKAANRIMAGKRRKRVI